MVARRVAGTRTSADLSNVRYSTDQGNKELDAGRAIECKLTPASRLPSTEICFAHCDPATLTFDLLDSQDS